MALATQPDASAILRDAAPVRGYHVAEPADVSSEQYLGSFACVIEAIVSVIKVWSSLHVHSGIRKMCVVFDSDAAVFQCTLVCRENDIPKPRQWRFTEPRKFCLILYAISLASAWVAAIESRGRHDIVNESPSRQQKAYRQPCYCEARKPDLQVQIYQLARCGLPRATTTFHIRKIGCLSNIAHTRQMYRGSSRRSKSLRVSLWRETSAKLTGIAVGLPTNMPKTWFVALAALSKWAMPRRAWLSRTTWSCRPATRRPSARHDAQHDRSAQRIEGDLEVGLDVESGRGMRAEVTAPLYRDFEHIIEGRPPPRRSRWRRGSAASARSRSRSPRLPLFAMRWRPRSRRTGYSSPIPRMRRRMPPIISCTSTSSSCRTSLARCLCRACMTRHGTVSQRSAALRHAMSCRGGRGCSNHGYLRREVAA